MIPSGRHETAPTRRRPTMPAEASMNDARGADGPAAPLAGWAATLELRFVAGEGGTRLAGNRHQGPLRLLKALASEDGRRLEAVVVHPPGGLVGGDSLSLALEVDAGARVLATTPGAQKWYGRSQRAAASDTRLVVADGALLEWLPQPAIVYDGARARQAVAVEVDRGGCFIGWEALVRGRTAMGERYASGDIEQTLAIAIGQAPAWHERLGAAADDRLFDSPLGWDGRLSAASVWCCAPAVEEPRLRELRDRWRALLVAAMPGGGATIPVPGMLIAKLLCDDSEILMARCRDLWRAARIFLEGDAGSLPRIWHT